MGLFADVSDGYLGCIICGINGTFYMWRKKRAGRGRDMSGKKTGELASSEIPTAETGKQRK